MILNFIQYYFVVLAWDHHLNQQHLAQSSPQSRVAIEKEKRRSALYSANWLSLNWNPRRKRISFVLGPGLGFNWHTKREPISVEEGKGGRRVKQSQAECQAVQWAVFLEPWPWTRQHLRLPNLPNKLTQSTCKANRRCISRAHITQTRSLGALKHNYMIVEVWGQQFKTKSSSGKTHIIFSLNSAIIKVCHGIHFEKIIFFRQTKNEVIFRKSTILPGFASLFGIFWPFSHFETSRINPLCGGSAEMWKTTKLFYKLSFCLSVPVWF